MYRTTIIPRLGETDGLRHVNHARVVEWFETARNPIFRLFDPALDFTSFDLIMARLEVDFLRPMVWGQEVEVRTWVVHLGNSSFTVGHHAVQEGRICARGQFVIVHYDFRANRSKPLRDDQRAALAEHLISQEEFAAG
jgi:acyl-CoA thioester hydrolase